MPDKGRAKRENISLDQVLTFLAELEDDHVKDLCRVASLVRQEGQLRKQLGLRLAIRTATRGAF